MPGPKLDRLMLMAVTKMNLSPIFGLYPDPEKEAEKLLDMPWPARLRYRPWISRAWCIGSGR